jgi:hypothetical protein
MASVASRALFVSGLLMIAAAAAHATAGATGLRAALAEAGAGPGLVLDAIAGWYLGSATMATLGTIVVMAARRWRQGDPSALSYALAVSLCYVAFGAAAFVASGWHVHFLGFIVLGLLAGVPALAGRSRRS